MVRRWGERADQRFVVENQMAVCRCRSDLGRIDLDRCGCIEWQRGCRVYMHLFMTCFMICFSRRRIVAGGVGHRLSGTVLRFGDGLGMQRGELRGLFYRAGVDGGRLDLGRWLNGLGIGRGFD